MTALLHAASMDRTEIAGLLLEANADPDMADSRGLTALMWAVLNKNENMVRLLLRYKPNLAAKNDMGYSVADYVKLLGSEREFAQLQELER